jgi:AraC family transcriptional regulator, glycine betaine-responsive activator
LLCDKSAAASSHREIQLRLIQATQQRWYQAKLRGNQPEKLSKLNLPDSVIFPAKYEHHKCDFISKNPYLCATIDSLVIYWLYDNMPTVQQHTIVRYGFLLVPNYSMMALSSAIEPLRMANYLAKQPLYEWVIVTLDGSTIPASSGMKVHPDYAIDDCPKLEALFVCGGINVANNYSRALRQALNRIATRKTAIGSLCTGAYLLARSGLLDGYKCTIHWENIASMREEFPRLEVTQDLFVIDRDRYTCSGGSASFDMMVQLMATHHPDTPAAEISDYFMWGRVRGNNDNQLMPLELQLGTSNAKLVEAIALMDNNIEEPISLEELAHFVGVSRRQLERIFRKYLDCVPSRYYMNLRLKHANKLLRQTNKSIIEVALMCGFVSAPHFSKCYREFYGVAPRNERRK